MVAARSGVRPFKALDTRYIFAISDSARLLALINAASIRPRTHQSPQAASLLSLSTKYVGPACMSMFA